eukprot:899152-Prymnesium_polylepis.1
MPAARRRCRHQHAAGARHAAVARADRQQSRSIRREGLRRQLRARQVDDDDAKPVEPLQPARGRSSRAVQVRLEVLQVAAAAQRMPLGRRQQLHLARPAGEDRREALAVLLGHLPNLEEALHTFEVRGWPLVDEQVEHVAHTKRALDVAQALELGDRDHAARHHGRGRRSRSIAVATAAAGQPCAARDDRVASAVGRRDGIRLAAGARQSAPAAHRVVALHWRGGEERLDRRLERWQPLAVKLHDHPAVERRAARHAHVQLPAEEDLVVADVHLQLQLALVVIRLEAHAVRVECAQRAEEADRRVSIVA